MYVGVIFFFLIEIGETPFDSANSEFIDAQRDLCRRYDMKFYEAPDFKKIDFTTDDVLTDGSILDPTDGLGNSGNVELGEIPLFGNN